MQFESEGEYRRRPSHATVQCIRGRREEHSQGCHSLGISALNLASLVLVSDAGVDNPLPQTQPSTPVVPHVFTLFPASTSTPQIARLRPAIDHFCRRAHDPGQNPRDSKAARTHQHGWSSLAWGRLRESCTATPSRSGSQSPAPPVGQWSCSQTARAPV